MTLLDEALPEWDFRELHRAEVDADPGAVYRALFELEASDVAFTRVLMALRSVPGRLAGGAPELGGRLVEDMETAGFRKLAESPEEEIVYGIVGRFWHPWRNLERRQPADLEAFCAYAPPRQAKAAWNFRFEALGDGRTRVATETRIRATDAASRRRFRLYWTLIRPGSGLIRRDLLRALGRRAERTSGLPVE